MREDDHDQFTGGLEQPIAAGIGGGQVLIPRSEPESVVQPHVKAKDGSPLREENNDHDAYEGDGDLLSPGSSPEFEHLRKPPHLSEEKPGAGS